MGKKIIFSLIIAGLCFGQGIEIDMNSNVSLVVSRSMYINPLKQGEYLPMHELALCSAPHVVYPNSSFSPSALTTQVESESLQQKTQGWKQTGIYGLELFGATIGSFPAVLYGTLSWQEAEKIDYRIATALNSLLCGSATWLTGKLLNQKGSWLKASLGSGLGTIIGIYLHNRFHDPSNWFYPWPSYYVAPPLGAVIGYNL